MENNIEEAIKVMEHWIEYEKNNKEKINRADELINIQEIILSDYKRVLKENEELRAKWDKDTHILQNKLDYANADRIDLEQQNKELRKENEELNYKLHSKKIALEIYNRYIPKSKIKAKIEQLNSESYAEKLEDMMNTKNYTITELVQYVLQELLDGSDTDVGSIGSEN